MSSINPKAVVQEINLTKDDLKFKIPFSMCISGPSQSGKSELIVQLIKYRNLVFEANFERIIYCQPSKLAHRPNLIFEKLRELFPSVELVSDLPDVSKLQLDLFSRASLVIIDDQMNAFLDSPEMFDLQTIQSHHFNISLIFTLQNYFGSSKYGKTLVRNANIKFFFFNRLDLNELRHISSQITPKYPNFLESCFEFLIKKFPKDPSHYILIDGHYRCTAPDLFIRSRIFPESDEDVPKPIIFFPK